MAEVATTRLSSKGQIVIPEAIRDLMGLKTGMEFVVLAEKDVVVLKALTPPDLTRFSSLIHRARFQARKVSLKKADGKKRKKRK